jgi:hypothetical protein
LLLSFDHKRSLPNDPAEAVGNVEAVEFLLKAGANKNLKCISGFTALDYVEKMYNPGNFRYISTDRSSYLFTQEEIDNSMLSYKKIIDLLK